MSDPFRPRYVIESIEVKGNEITRGGLIMSYLQFKPGEILDQERVELSRFRLLALGFFSDVRTRLERGSKRGLVKVVVEVQERWTLLVNDVFLGSSASNPFWAGLGVRDINFLGLGMELSGAFVASGSQHALKLGAFWPSVLESGLSLGIDGFYTGARERAMVGDMELGSIKDGFCGYVQNQDLDYKRAGGATSIGMNLSQEYRLSFTLHVEHIEARFDDTWGGAKCSNYPFLGYVKIGQSTLLSFETRFIRDTRDNLFLPTRGMHLVISVELASKALFTVSDYEYSKYMIRYEQNFPIWLDHVLRLTATGGLIQDVGEKSPFFKRFFVGDHSLYLVNKDSLPRNLEVNFSTETNYGDLLGSIEVEYDVPLWSSGQFFYRGYAYTGLNFTCLTKASFLRTGEEWVGRAKRPVSFDLGLKFETPLGLMTFSVGYLLDIAY
jgi:outer membrane protein insertion porin family